MSELQALHQQISACLDCSLCKTRTHAVPGEGPENAEIMFIGEGPGFNEDQQARPFVGAAGKFLEQLITSAGLRRSDVYITNVVKCRPPQNRDPLPEEIEACSNHLDRQIQLIRPRLIVTLGRYSLARFFPREPIGRLHGQLRTHAKGNVLPMYHPAAALHAGNMRGIIEQDFRRLPEVLAEVRNRRLPEPQPLAVPSEPPAQQMSLF
ncbi:MAG TPA: uracil-DNA glycosylase [Dehalococcoidia bacterium]|nr:uracil-DNA glycosylase [Dehalococcoidia bacterium]